MPLGVGTRWAGLDGEAYRSGHNELDSKSCYLCLKLNNYTMETYRSGHNEPDSKSGSPQGLVGSNPTVSATKPWKHCVFKAFFVGSPDRHKITAETDENGGNGKIRAQGRKMLLVPFVEILCNQLMVFPCHVCCYWYLLLNFQILYSMTKNDVD